MIQIDILMPTCCDDCRFCLIDYTDDNKPDSFAYCCVAEKHIAQACDGTDRIVSTAILKKQQWCPLKAQEPELVHVTADINHRKIGECPTCGKWINSGDHPNYCGHCGQKVRWG